MTARCLIGLAALLGLPSLAQAADASPQPAAPRLVAASQAALPAPLNGLAAQVAGVMGSGDKLSLMLRQGETSRTLKPGDLYEDGWVLTGLSADVATFAKAGQTRQVGLNPDGALAGRELAGASEVKVTPRIDPAAIEALMQGLSANGLGRAGLSAADAQQMMAQARDYMNSPAGQAAISAAYDQAVSRYGQGAIDSLMAGQGRGGTPLARAASPVTGGQ